MATTIKEWSAYLRGKFITYVTGSDFDEALKNFKIYASENGISREMAGYVEGLELYQLCTCAASCSCECACGSWDDIECDCYVDWDD